MFLSRGNKTKDNFVGAETTTHYKNLVSIMPQKAKNPLTAMAAGCIAGGVEATCVWPMEYIKVSGRILPEKVEEFSSKISVPHLFRF